MASEKKIVSNLTVKVGLVLFAGCILVPISLMVLFRHAVPLQTLRLLFSVGSASSVMWEEEKMDSANDGALLCDMSSLRSDVCELKGNVRVILSNATVVFLQPSASVRRQSWRMKPHARKKKNDRHALAGVTEVPVSVTSCSGMHGRETRTRGDLLGRRLRRQHVPRLHRRTRPAVHHLWFLGDVHLLVGDAPPWWLDKYRRCSAGSPATPSSTWTGRGQTCSATLT